MKNRIPSLIFIILAVFVIISNDVFAQRIKWEQTSGPGGGLLSSMSVLSDGLVFVTQSTQSVDGGARLYRSSDYGVTWSQVGGALKLCYSVSFTEVQNLIFAAEGHGSFFISSDRGVTWSLTKIGYTPHEYPYTYLTSLHDTLFWSGREKGVLRSIDSGKSWQRIVNGLPYSINVHLDTISGYTIRDTNIYSIEDLVSCRSGILVSTKDGVYKSTDGGNQWLNVSDGLQGLGVYGLSSFGDTVFAITKSGIFATFNGGMNWNLSLDKIAFQMAFNKEVVAAYMSDSSYWVSMDVGKTWLKQSDKTMQTLVTSIGLSGTTNYISTFGQGVLRSNDFGSTWIQSNYRLNNIRTRRLAVKNHILFASGLQCGVFRSSDGGNHWSQVLPISLKDDLYNSINSYFSWEGYLFAADNYSLYRSYDVGLTWSDKANRLGQQPSNICTFNSIGDLLLLGSNSGWFSSKDSGGTWTMLSSKGTLGSLYSKDTIWSSTGLYASGVWLSMDTAKSWDYINSVPLSALTPDSSHQRIYGDYSFGEFIRVRNNTSTLTQALPYRVTHASNILCMEDHIFVCTEKGLYETTDYGLSWQADTAGIGSMQVNDVAADDDTLYLSTENGVYRGVYENLTGVNTNTIDNSSIPVEMYPNPNHGSLGITYTIGDRTDIKFEIINLLGQVVKTFQVEQQVSGSYTLKYDISSLPTGSYFVRMTTENGLKMKNLKIFK